MTINLVSLDGEIIKTYIEFDCKKLYEDFLCNFKLIYENKIVSMNDNIIFQDNISLTMIKLPTKYLI